MLSLGGGSNPRSSAETRTSPLHPAGVGLLVVSGWILHDLALTASLGQPDLVAGIVPGSLLAVVLGASTGVFCSFHRRAWIALMLVVLAVVAAGVAVRPAFLAGREALFLAVPALTFGGGATAWLVRHRRFAPFSSSLAVGALLAAGLLWTRLLAGATVTSTIARLQTPAGRVGVVTGTVALLFLAGQVTRPGRRAVAAACAVAAVLGISGYEALTAHRLPRADRELASAGPVADRPNVVLIVLDTVRAHRLAPYGHDRITTPRLDAWVADHATTYGQARSTSSWTLPAHASLFTGLLPAEHGATHPRGTAPEDAVTTAAYPALPLDPGIPTLAEQLADRGFRTAALVANAAYLDHSFGLDRGFEHYDDRGVRKLPGHPTLAQLLGFRPDIGRRAYRSAEVMTDLALDRLERFEKDRPYFLFVNYLDAHWPYLAPPPFDDLFGDARPVNPLVPEPDLFPLLYDRELSHLDHHLGRLLKALEEDPRFDDTLVVVTSDHGEAFGEHGFWYHDKSVYEEVIKVPLYVKPPGGRRTGRDDEPITGAGVFRLIADEVGLEPPARRETSIIAEWYRSEALVRHRNWARERRGDGTLGESDLDRDLVAWLDDRFKVIVSSRGEVEIFDLDNDPLETRDLAASGTHAEEQAAAAIWWAENPPTGGVRDALDPELLERLQSLGYVD